MKRRDRKPIRLTLEADSGEEITAALLLLAASSTSAGGIAWVLVATEIGGEGRRRVECFAEPELAEARRADFTDRVPRWETAVDASPVVGGLR